MMSLSCIQPVSHAFYKLCMASNLTNSYQKCLRSCSFLYNIDCLLCKSDLVFFSFVNRHSSSCNLFYVSWTLGLLHIRFLESESL